MASCTIRDSSPARQEARDDPPAMHLVGRMSACESARNLEPKNRHGWERRKAGVSFEDEGFAPILNELPTGRESGTPALPGGPCGAPTRPSGAGIWIKARMCTPRRGSDPGCLKS